MAKKKNPISHVEWRTKDAARLQKFYSAVFNWKFKAAMDGYTMVDFGNKDIPAGGIFAINNQSMPTGICNYATVEDLAPHEESIKANGGTVLMSNQEIPGVGWFTVFKDPDGNEFALWKQFVKDKKAEKKAKKAAKAAKEAAKEAKKQAKKEAEKAAKAAKKAAKKQKTTG